MNISSQVGPVTDQPGLAQSVQIATLNRARTADANAVLPLLNSAMQQSAQIQASNPPYLGQNIDVRA